MTTDATVEDLTAFISSALGEWRVDHLMELSGGASRETWAFDADGVPLILQRDRTGGGLRRAAMATEVAAITAAAAAGVGVARVVAEGDGWFITERVQGETIPRRILRDETYACARETLIVQLAAAAAAVHSIDPGAVPGLREESLASWRDEYNGYGECRPAFELAFRHLERSPVAPRRGVVHGDFRLGNVIVGPEGLRALIDWEMVHLGDPAEDLGFLCVRSWRFGGRLPVAGLGTRGELLAAYNEAAGVSIREVDLFWAEAWGTLRWGIIAMRQLHTHLSGAHRSVELAAIGRRISEVEYDLLSLLGSEP